VSKKLPRQRGNAPEHEPRREPLTDQSLAHPAQAERKTNATRFERGIILAQEHFEEIHRVAPWTWEVQSRSGSGVYTVNLKHATCSCLDRTPEGEECKHLVASRYIKAKTGVCEGCRQRLRHCELYPVPEDHLTFFEHELLCEECAIGAGIL
jgi:hypothetical protein